MTSPAEQQNALVTLDQYQGKANVLVPTQHMQQVSPWHRIRVSEVRVDPDPLKGDVFKVGSRWNNDQKANEDLYSPGKPALMRIASAAGIVWNWRDSGPESLTRDYVVYKAVGAIRLPDGSWQPIMARKEIDLAVIEEETQEANLKKGAEYQGDDKKRSYLKGLSVEDWAVQQTKAAMIQWRKNKLQRAETGAMLRVIRAALGMKSQYTREELAKPFIVPAIDFSPDYSDPEVRHLLLERGAQAMGGLFGQAGGSPAAAFALPAGADQPAAIRAPLESAAAGDDETSAEDDLLPWDDAEPTDSESSACAACGATIEDVTITISGKERFFAAPDIAENTKQKYGQQLCWGCAQERAKGAAS